MQNKLTLIVLLAGMATATAMGGVAYAMLMRAFDQTAQDEAFDHFRQDMAAYIGVHGGWDNAVASEPFDHFVRRRRPMRRPPPPAEGVIARAGPPFHFLLLDPSGRVMRGVAAFPQGSQAPATVMRHARPISYGGKVVVLAAPVGEPILSPRDQSYLAAMRKSLVTGIGVAALLAIAIGLLFGRRLGLTLGRLTTAIRAMRTDCEAELYVPVVSRDELGELAAAFNQMNSDLCRAHRELRELSLRDPLTGLSNRRHFLEEADKLLALAIRHHHPLAVMIGDLDHFKRVNDEFSHAIGDEVLRRVATILQEATRKSDLVARFGGEEFVVLLAESGREQAAQRCEALRDAIESHAWHELHPALRVTMSMGLSDDVAAGSVEKMIAQADVQLYAAKKGGRNRVVAEPAEA